MIEPDKIRDRKLGVIAQKVLDQIPVNREDAAYMLATNDILDLGSIANHIRNDLHGNTTFYSVNMNLNYTNICELRCPLCAFSCDPGDENAYLLTLEDIEERVKAGVAYGIDEVHIVGGLWDELKLDYFESMLRLIKKLDPDLHIVAFTAVEYDYFARKAGLSLPELFERLIDAGVDAIPGGGAEIFAPGVRNKIAPKKISGNRWLEVMKIAHEHGLKTNATMLYNHQESLEDQVDHMFRIREVQDETGGFKTFVPLNFHEENTEISARRSSTGYDDIRLYATARIVLHNVPHIKALWMYLGDKMAQTLQSFGVDDISGTYFNEKVVHAAGAKTSDRGSEPHLQNLIESAGYTHCRITASYRKRSEGNKE